MRTSPLLSYSIVQRAGMRILDQLREGIDRHIFELHLGSWLGDQTEYAIGIIGTFYSPLCDSIKIQRKSTAMDNNGNSRKTTDVERPALSSIELACLTRRIIIDIADPVAGRTNEESKRSFVSWTRLRTKDDAEGTLR